MAVVLSMHVLAQYWLIVSLRCVYQKNIKTSVHVARKRQPTIKIIGRMLILKACHAQHTNYIVCRCRWWMQRRSKSENLFKLHRIQAIEAKVCKKNSDKFLYLRCLVNFICSRRMPQNQLICKSLQNFFLKALKNLFYLPDIKRLSFC